MTELLAIGVPALARVLLHFLWQGALIGAGAALALHLLRHARPQARYAVACIALLACVIVPLATFAMQLAPVTIAPDRASAMPGADSSLLATRSARTSTASGFVSAQSWIVLLWAFGAALMAIRMVMGLAWIRRLPLHADAALHATWQARLDAIAHRFALGRRVVLRIVEGLDTPASYGWWRPVVVVPAALIARLSPDLIEALLAHELAHVRRHDFLLNLIQAAVEALLFYHPVVWWLSRRIRIEREEIADGVASQRACAPRRLADALVALCEFQVAAVPRLAQAADGGSLMTRIERLLRPAPRSRPGAPLALGVVAVAATFIACLAYAQATPHAVVATSDSATELHSPRVTTRDTYVMARDGRYSAWGPLDTADTEAAALDLDGDFYWAHRNGVGYVVTDADLVARAYLAWEEIDAITAKLEAWLRPDASYAPEMEQSAAALEARLEQIATHDLRSVLDEALARGSARASPLKASARR